MAPTPDAQIRRGQKAERVQRSQTNAIDGLDGRLTELTSDLRRAEMLLSHVPGHKRGLQRHSREIKILRGQVEQLIRNRATTGTTDERQLQEVTAPVKKLMGDLATLATQVADHEKRIGDTESRLDGHDELFDSLKRGNEEAIGRVTIVGESLARAHARIDVINQARGIHPIAWVLGAIAGIISVVLWAVHDWSQTTTVNQAKVVVENTAADSLWAAVICGLGVGLLVLFVTSLLTGDGSNNHQQTAEADAMAASRVEMTNAERTQVHPVVPPPTPPPPVANQQQ